MLCSSFRIQERGGAFMKRTRLVLFLTLCSFFFFRGAAIAADVTNPILRKLVEKGILTQEEALSVMEEIEQEGAKKDQVEKKVEKVAKDVEEIKKDSENTMDLFKGLSIGVKGYFDYRNGDGADQAGSGLNRDTFRVTRAYLDVKKRLTEDLLVRWTSDYETKANQSDSNVFMKYLYLEYKPPFPSASELTAGIIPAPYIGYYEEIWPYRMRDKIPQERFKVLDASADMGVLLNGRFRKADSDMISYALGVFNNQHYRVNDNNRNKALEGRFSVRPLAATGVEFLKGLELTYFGIRGKDGAESDKGTDPYGDHKNDTFMTSYNYGGLTLGYEYYKTTRFGGTKEANTSIYDESTDGLNPGAANKLFFDGAKGETLFAVYRLPGVFKPVRLFGEYAVLDDIRVGTAASPKDGNIRSSLFGLSYDVYKEKTVLVLNYNKVQYEEIGTAEDDGIYQAVIQIAY